MRGRVLRQAQSCFRVTAFRVSYSEFQGFQHSWPTNLTHGARLFFQMLLLILNTAFFPTFWALGMS